MVSPFTGGVHHVELVMGTAVSIDVRDPDAQRGAVDAVIEWLHHVDDVFSPYKFDSPISAIGRGDVVLAGLSWDVRDEIGEVLTLCETMCRRTAGAFDAFEVPAPNGTRFDPSGLVKGWSIERSAVILESRGLVNFCINAGGDVAIRGRPSAGQPWRVGIRHPTVEDAIATVVEAADRLAIATSATYERGDHIMNPRTGLPAAELASATVVGPDLTVADAYATAAFVMGLEALEWIDDQLDYDVYLIKRDGTTYWSSGFPK
jgi:thiamine biosynthesis lipoprotein